jgi:hypothetical protein
LPIIGEYDSSFAAELKLLLHPLGSESDSAPDSPKQSTWLEVNAVDFDAAGPSHGRENLPSNSRMKETLRAGTANDAARDPTQSAAGSRKSKTPIGIGNKLGRASSRLPAKSGLWRAMEG